MNHGSDKSQTEQLHADALELLLAGYRQNKAVLTPQAPYIYDRLHRLVQECRYRLHRGHQAPAQAALRDGLYELLGVDVDLPPDRHLSILAGLIRRVLADHMWHRSRSILQDNIDWLTDNPCYRLTAHVEIFTDNLYVLAIDAGLEKLSVQHPDSVCLLELYYFTRLNMREMALELAVPLATVKRDFRLAQAWLTAFLQERD
ncbi:MAG: ECF-type sigma factor [Steroidobacteraceae bacterium]